MSQDLENKRIILIASQDNIRRDLYTYIVHKHVQNSTVYTANDGSEALSKINNVVPNVLILDKELPKFNSEQILESLSNDKMFKQISFIIVSPFPEKEVYLDELVTGQVQFLLDSRSEVELNQCLVKALNYSSHSVEKEFYLRFLSPKECLIKDGDHADYVYFVRKGRLKAFKQNSGEAEVLLGYIEAGEFVGEMAYINGEVRSANVYALTDCELIEVPIGTLDKVLYQKPSWSKALMKTLSHRVKIANEKKSESL